MRKYQETLETDKYKISLMTIQPPGGGESSHSWWRRIYTVTFIGKSTV